MKLLSTLAATVAAFAFAMPAAALPVQFTANLDGLTELPPNASTAFGDALLTVDDTDFTVTVHVIFSGLIGGPATAGHIHCCTAVPGMGNVGVFQGFPGFPNATAGTYDNIFTLSSARFATLLTGIEQDRAYVNIHDSTFPGGEIRGFVVPEPFLVPEPAMWALVLTGFGIVGATTKRRRATA